MDLQVARDDVLPLLQAVAGVIERRRDEPMLSNVLLETGTHLLSLTGTDLDVELMARMTLSTPTTPAKITVSARKLIDICKNLPAGALLTLKEAADRLTIRSGRSRFVLSTLPADTFPSFDQGVAEHEFTANAKSLRYLFEKTHFSMALQDARYYLNGLFLELKAGVANTVATDGHRMALASLADPAFTGEASVLIPRKGVVELLRILGDSDERVDVALNKNHIRVTTATFQLSSKLIEGRFPDYSRVIPKPCERQLIFDRDTFREALTRVLVLSNDKCPGVRLAATGNQLHLLANNNEQEEAEDELTVEYSGEAFETAFNITYLIDALNHLPAGKGLFALSDGDGGLLLQSPASKQLSYVIMPMRL